ncbi:MAG: hypothetical protein WBE52_14250, partial [Terriglobales bacterium]
PSANSDTCTPVFPSCFEFTVECLSSMAEVNYPRLNDLTAIEGDLIAIGDWREEFGAGGTELAPPL